MKRWLVVMVVLVAMAFSSSALAANVHSELKGDNRKVSPVFAEVDADGSGEMSTMSSSDGGAIWPKGIWGL